MENAPMPRSLRLLIGLASFVVIVAAFRTAGALLIPFLLSVFIAIICTPILFWLQRRRVPNALAVLIIVIGIICLAILLISFVGSSLNDFVRSLPVYQTRLKAKTVEYLVWLNRHGIELSSDVILAYFDPGVAMRLAANTLTRLSSALTNAFLILLTVVFILLEASSFPRKLAAIFSDPDRSLRRFERISESINRYLAIKSIFSLVTGALVALWLLLLGVDYPLLWGVVAVLLNFVPNIGSLIASVPAVLLAVVQLGLASALLTALGYAVINVTIGSIIEPRFMGRGLGLSTLVVFLSLVFWGWVLGPVGMLLSVPLTMIVKIALESSDETRWLAILLGTDPPAAALITVSEENSSASPASDAGSA